MLKSVSCTSLCSLDEPQLFRRSLGGSVPTLRPMKVLANDLRQKRGSSTTAQAMSPWHMNLGQALSNEISVESSLHISAIQALPCEAEFGPLEVAPATAIAWEEPQPQGPDQGVLQYSPPATTILARSAQAINTKSLAACLATPTEAADPPEREDDVPHKAKTVQPRSASVPNLRYQLSVQPQLQDVGRVETLDRLTNLVRRIRRRRRIDQIKSLLSFIPSPASSVRT